MDRGPPKSQNPSKRVEVPERVVPDFTLFRSILQKHAPVPMFEVLSEIIYSRFCNAQNPYVYTLDLLYYSSEFFGANSSTFNKTILNLFKKFLLDNGANVKQYLNPEIQKLALNMFLQLKTQPWLELACQLFDFYSAKEILREIIYSHFTNGRHRQAINIIMVLEMQPFFLLEQIALPLIFFDERVSAECYLKKYPQMQLELVKKLDSACSSTYRIREFISCLNLQIKNTSKFDMKYMQKTLTKLLKTFNIPIEECPNLLLNRSFGALNYLMRKRFQEREMTDESWEEMVLDTVKNNKRLQKELVVRLACINEMDMALKMAQTFNLSKDQWPESILYYLEKRPLRSSPQPSPSKVPDDSSSFWDNELDDSAYSEAFLTLPLPESSIYLIDSTEKFMDCICAIESYDIVGFDAEWRPSFGVTTSGNIALLQLAVWDCVFLLDTVVLLQELTPSHWTHLMDKLFCNPHILKIGFGVRSDITAIRDHCAGGTKNPFVKVLDFDKFFQEILNSHPQISSYLPTFESGATNSNSDRGLSKLCRTVLGVSLKKTEQLSDWERRPLRKAQIDYAALDAYCLLLIYDELAKVMQKLDLNMAAVIFDHMNTKQVTPDKSVKEKKQVMLKKIAEESRIRYHSRPPIPISEFRVMVDNMLLGFGKQLRMCGADVVILECKADHDMAVKRALSENRYFLTTGKVYVQMANYLPDGMCYNVNTKLDLSQQLSATCEYFNVQYSEDDVFTRCTLCNCNNYLKIKSDDMKRLRSQIEVGPSHVEQFPTPWFYYKNGFVTKSGLMHTGVRIKIEGLTAHVLATYPEFQVCCNCGKVYWEGSHHQHKKETMQSWIKSNIEKKAAQEENVGEASSSKIGSVLYSYEATISTSKNSQSRFVPAVDTAQKTIPTKLLIPAEELSSEDDYDYVTFN